MNMAFFGSSLVSAYWNGAATYYRGLIRELHALGWRVTFYEPDAYGRQQHRDMDDPHWARVVVYPPTQDGVEACLEQAAGADVVVKASGVGVFDEYLEREVLRLRSPSTLAVYWDVDAPATLSRIASDPADAMRANLPRYDLVLTYGGGQPVVQSFEKLGARLCVPIYNGFSPETHHPVGCKARFRADLSFLGNRLPDRETRVEEFFLKAAERLPGRNFLLGGNGWGDKPMPANVRWVGHVYTTDHNALNCSALAVLNINRESMALTGWSPATRVFEAAAAGACIITDAFTGVGDFFEPGREILVAGSGEEVADILAGLSPRKARVIGLAALERAMDQHTYARRARGLDWLLRGEITDREAAQCA